MTVVPNRKVLKNVLSKLKAETVISQRRFEQSSEHQEKLFDMVVKTLKKAGVKEMKVHNVLEIVSRLQYSFNDFVLEVIRLIEMHELYIESLERHSSELDKAFWKIIEKKSKEIVRKIEQQREQSKQQKESKNEQNPLSV